MKKSTNTMKCSCGQSHEWNYDSTRREPKIKHILSTTRSIVANEVRVRTCGCGAVLQLPNDLTIKAKAGTNLAVKILD